MRKSSVCEPRAARGEKSRRYGHRGLEKNRKSANFKNPVGQSANRSKTIPKKTLRSIQTAKIGTSSGFRHRSHAWATDVLKLFGALNFSKSSVAKAKIALGNTKNHFAPRVRAILAQDRKPENRFGGRPFEPPNINLSHKKHLPLEVCGPWLAKKGPKAFWPSVKIAVCVFS